VQKIPFNVTQAERDLGATINRAIAGTGYTAYPKVKVKSVIGKQENDHLDRNDKKAFEDAEFDVVVLDENNIGVFAAEYDGPCHEKREKLRSDARKNAWCFQAGLPLLRISDWEISKEDQGLFVIYLIERHLAFKKELPSIIEEIKKKYGQEEIDRRYDEGLIPRDMDAYRVFDSRYPFPEFNALIKKIAEDFDIFVLFQPPTKTLLLEKRTPNGLRLIPVELATETKEIERGEPGLTRCIFNGGRLYGETEGTKTVFTCWWYIIRLSGAESGGYSFSDAGGPISVSGGYKVINQNKVSLTLDTTLPLKPNSELTADNTGECTRKGLGIPRIYAGLPGSEFSFVSNSFTCYLASKAAYEWLSENESILRG
jgi:hypothetical protein